MFAIGIQLEGEPWRILLTRIDHTAPDEPTVSWLDVPAEGKAIRDVDIDIASDGNPVMAYTDFVGDQLNLYLIKCSDADCSDFSTSTIANRVRRDWDLTTGTDGTPYLVWGDVETDEAIIAKCIDSECVSLATVNTGLIGTQDWFASLAVPPDGYPMIAFFQSPAGLQLFNCLPYVCGSLTD